MSRNAPKKEKPETIEERVSAGLAVGMRCILSKKTDLRNPGRGKSDHIEVMGVKKFKFKEGDILVIDGLFLDNDIEKVQFHVERDGKWVEEHGTKVSFTFSRRIFVQRFLNISDIGDVVTATRGTVAGVLEMAS